MRTTLADCVAPDFAALNPDYCSKLSQMVRAPDAMQREKAASQRRDLPTRMDPGPAIILPDPYRPKQPSLRSRVDADWQEHRALLPIAKRGHARRIGASHEWFGG